MNNQINEGTVSIPLNGRIDSNNASQVEKQIQEQLEGKNANEVVLDASGLD